jgi:hypothetical protein
MRKLVRDCLLLCVLEHSRLIMDLFEQRRTSSIKARKMAYQEREGEKKEGGGGCDQVYDRDLVQEVNPA